MGKRILLFVATNVAIIVTLSIILRLLGVAGYIRPGGGLNFSALAVFCMVWGMGGAFISLLTSRWVAKRAVGVELINGQSGNAELDWLYNTVELRVARERKSTRLNSTPPILSHSALSST